MLLNKEDIPIIAMESMNETHFEDLEIINELFETVLAYEKEASLENEELINAKYSEWFEHTIAHFRGENEMMQERGFGPYFIHKSEHDNALALMDATFASWRETKDIAALKRYFVEVLPQWLVQHINSMDRVTALFLTDGISPCSVH